MNAQVFPRTLFDSESTSESFSRSGSNQRQIFSLRMSALGPRLRSSRQSGPSGLLYQALLVSLSFGLILMNSGTIACRENTERDAHIVLIRGLSSEVAVAKVPLPRGKHGVLIDSKGNLDQSKATAELRLNGVAISPGMPVEITRVTFKGNEMIFELNHGGKSGKKWYQIGRAHV